MKSKIFKSIALLIALCLTASLFTGCSVSMGSDDEGKVGGDLKIVSFYNIYPDDDTTAVGAAIKEYKKKYGANVTYTQYDYSVYNNKLLQLVAAGNAPDVIFAYWGDMPRLAAIQLVQPIEDYVDISKQNLPELMNSYKWQGKHYAASVQQVQTPLLWYNKSMLEKAGITEMPYDLWKADKWNWDKFLEYAKLLTVDTNGDGENDQWGFNTYNMSCFHWSNSATKIRTDDAGNVKITWKEESYLNATKFLQQLRFKDVVMTQDGTTAISDLANGVCAMAYGTYEMLGSLAQAGADTTKYAVAPFPTGPQFDGHYYSATNLVTIAKGAKNPKGAGALAELICEKEREMFGDKPNLASPDYTKYLDDKAMEVVSHGINNAQTYYEEGWGNWDPTYIYATNLMYDSKDPVTILDSIEPMLQAAINDMLSSASVINQEFKAPGTIDFENGNNIFVADGIAGKSEVTSEGALSGASSLKLTSTDQMQICAYTDVTKLYVPTYKVYEVKFKYNVTSAVADEFADFAVAFRTKSTLDNESRQVGWTSFGGEVGTSEEVTVKFELMGDNIRDYVLCFASNTSAGTAVIDDITITDVTPAE